MATETTTKWKSINLEKECLFERGMETGADAYNTEGIGDRFIRVVDVTESRDTPIFVDGIHTTKRVKKSDILLTLDGTVGAVRMGLEGIYSTGVRKVSFRNGHYSNRFLYYLLQSVGVQRKIDLFSSGSTIKHASAAIPQLLVDVPEDIQAQENIADILSTLDRTIERTDELIKKYERVREGMMLTIFKYGVDENGQINIETNSSKESPIGIIPSGWEVVSLLSVTAKITKGESPNWQGYEYQDEGILFITSENVRDGFIDYEKSKFIPPVFHSKLERSQLKNNDLLINLVGASIARSALFQSNKPANVNQAVALVRFNSQFDPRFYLAYLQIQENISRLLGEQVETARANLSLANIRNYLVPKPPLEEQERIADTIAAITNLLDAEKDYKSKLVSLRAGLMRDLFTPTK